jgi:hypothetical protein
MSADIRDLFALADRLADLQEQPPRPLVSHEDKQRDGPDNRHLEPFRGPKRVTGPSGASQRPLRYSYHSKGLES